MAKILLNRHNQRVYVRAALDELIDVKNYKICSILAYGREGNLVDMFAKQMLEHLQRKADDVAQVRRVELNLPEVENFDQDLLEKHMRQLLGLQPELGLKQALSDKMSRAKNGKVAVLILDWGVRGKQGGYGINADTLEVWLKFCRDILAIECPQGARLLSFLTLETDKHDIIAEVSDDLKNHPDFLEAPFRFEVLPPIDDVVISDLSIFLQSEHCSCFGQFIKDMPALILQKTNGNFAQTVQLIDEAEATSWSELRDQLLKIVKPQQQENRTHGGKNLT